MSKVPSNQSDPERVRAIFEIAFEAGPARWAEVLRAQCHGQPGVRAEVESLLSALGQADSADLLNANAVTPGGHATPDRGGDQRAHKIRTPAAPDAPTGSLSPAAGVDSNPSANTDSRIEGPGTRIGPYKLIQSIGEGGFGSVFMAKQEKPVARTVALKIVKLGMDTKQVVARFEQERQALALMDHPNIARVLDAGVTPSGRPYFVMDMVRGEPIDRFCDTHHLSIDDRLRLFGQVCAAIQHAHAKGIIHRDIKPSNVLVSHQEAEPLARVIDFGIAKATGASLIDRTLLTEQRQIIGTPEYMSPEQAEGSFDIDTRTDVYSLGVLLYVLLTGVPPFSTNQLFAGGYTGIPRIIREVDPPRPSTRLSQNDAPEAGVAANRRTDPKSLRLRLRGELDWIVMKALEKDRSRRYQTASELAADLERHLDGQAVLAAPPSRLYAARKFVRRNRGLALGTALVSLAVVAGLAGTLLAYFDATQQRERADLAAAEAREATAATSRQLYSASMLSASSAIDAAQFGTARFYLDSAPPALRGWEWRVLNARMDTSSHSFPTVRIPESPFDFTDNRRLLIHPDGESVFTVEASGTQPVRRWDFNTGRLLTTYTPTHDAATRAWILSHISLSEDGATLLALLTPYGTGAPAEHLTWNIESGRLLETRLIEAVPIGLWVGYPSKDGTTAFIGSHDRVTAVDVRTKRVIAQRPLPDELGPVVQSPDGTRLLIGGSRGSMCVFDASTLALLHDPGAMVGHTNYITSADFSRDNRWLVTGADDDSARVWDLSADPPTSIVLPHASPVWRVKFSPDASLVATADLTAVRVWDRQTGDLLGTYATAPITRTLAFHPDGRTVGTIEQDGTLRFWDVTANRTRVLHGHRAIVSRARFARSNPSGIIVSSSWEGLDGHSGTLRFWDADTGEPVGTLASAPGEIIYAMDVSSNGRFAIAAVRESLHADHLESRLERIDLHTGARIILARLDNMVFWVTIAPDGRTVAVGSPVAVSDRFAFEVALCDADTGATLRTIANGGRCAWSPDGSRLTVNRAVSTGSNGSVLPAQSVVLDAATLAPILTLVDAQSWGLAYSPDGARIALGGTDGILRVVDASSGALLASIAGHGAEIMAVEFSPDGSRIASVGMDRRVHLWDATTYDPVAAWGGHEGHIGDVDWDATGSRLVTASGDNTVRIWDGSSDRERVAAREARRTALPTVTPLVIAWMLELESPELVLDRIRNHPALSDVQRRTALQEVLRLGLEAQVPVNTSTTPDAQPAG